jgi:hypothetical protein
MRLGVPILPDSEPFFESEICGAAAVILASFLARIFHAKKLDLAQIFVGSSRHRAVSCVGVGRLVI